MKWKAIPLVLPLIAAATGMAQDHPAPGNLVFSELFIAPPGGKTTYEYVELYSLAPNPVSIDGCYIVLSEYSSTCDISDDIGACRPITSSTPIQPGQYALVARDETKWGTEGCGKTVSGVYSAISMSNTKVETISLYCNPPGGVDEMEPVASFTYDWSNVPFAETGHAYQLRENHLTLAEATDPANWCVAPPDAWSCAFDDNGTLRDMYGTPGEASICDEEIRHPGPGEVIIDEINAWATSTGSSPDWLEFHVISAPTEPPYYNLRGCEIGILTCANDDPEACLALADVSYTKTYEFDTLLTLSQDQYVVAATGAESTCLRVNTDPNDAVEDYTCELWSDLPMDLTLTHTDAELRRIDLNCPDDGTNDQRTIDSVVYNHAWVKATCCQEQLHCSWELRTERTGSNAEIPSLANDDVANWDVAPAREAYSSGADLSSDPVTVEENYASPKAVNGVAARVERSAVTEGDLVFTELAAWPGTSTSSPDWLELLVVGQPESGRFDLQGCVLRNMDCDEMGVDPETCLETSWKNDDWTKTSEIDPAECREESTLWVASGDRFLIGNSESKTCLESDETGTCTRSVDARVTSTVALPGGNRLLELACPTELGGVTLATVDRIVYNNDWGDPTCYSASGRCAWALRPDALSDDDPALANDLPQAWTSAITEYVDPDNAVALGTPGEPNGVAPQVAVRGRPGPGDVAWSEQMVDYPASPEWFELEYTGDTPGYLELAGCMVLQERFDDQTGTEEDDTAGGAPTLCTPEDPGECYKSYEIPSTLHFPIGSSESDTTHLRRVLARGSCLSYGPPSENDATPEPGAASNDVCPEQGRPDLNYGTALDFSSSTPEALSLWCPDEDGTYQLVDRFEYDWSDWNDLCLGTDDTQPEGCSLSVHQDHVNAEDNDCDFYRCAASVEEGAYYDTKGRLFAGTPGEENHCSPIPYTPRGPAAGSDTMRPVVINEISILPAGDNSEVGRFSHEWFEIYNPGSVVLDLDSCRFLVGSELDDNGFIVDPNSEYAIAGNPQSIEPGEYQVWALDGCIMGSVAGGEEATTPTPATDQVPEDVVPRLVVREGTCDVPADVAYEKLSFPNTTPKYFQLVCRVACGEEEVIDTILVDAEGQGIEEGHSWELDPAYQDVTANDDPKHWCQASYQQVFGYEELGKNYGTPGEANACIPPPECGEVAVSCHCNLSENDEPPGGRLAVLFLAVSLVGFLRFRRP